MKTIENTQDLRSFLIDAMQQVAAKKMDHGDARAITNLAQQIYNTVSAEIRFANLRATKGENLKLEPIEFDK